MHKNNTRSLERSRRSFLKDSLLAGGALATAAATRACAAADSPGEAVVLGVIGVNGRGLALAESFAAVGGAQSRPCATSIAAPSTKPRAPWPRNNRRRLKA